MDKIEYYVPAFIDNPGYPPDIDMVRLTYLYLDILEPVATELSSRESPFSMIIRDFDGVITGGLDNHRMFESPEIIAELFEYIDQKTAYAVSTSYLWLPHRLIQRFVKKTLTKGDVLRIDSGLFLRACAKLRMPDATEYDGLNMNIPLIYYSEKETAAFKQWTDRTIERVKNRYRERPAFNLRTRALDRGK